jgi:amino acid transporter
MVVVKLCIILLVIAVGVFYVDTANWDPFAPNGVGGVLKGVSAVFFAYIGFDAISTTAEECKDPQRDLPKGMMWALIICTILYVVIALVLTGMVNYADLNVGDPLAFVFEKLDLKWMSGIIAKCCCCHGERIVSVSNGTTPYMDEHEPRWFVAQTFF